MLKVVERMIESWYWKKEAKRRVALMKWCIKNKRDYFEELEKLNQKKR